MRDENKIMFTKSNIKLNLAVNANFLHTLKLLSTEDTKNGNGQDK
jgi:hypothetical protein